MGVFANLQYSVDSFVKENKESFPAFGNVSKLFQKDNNSHRDKMSPDGGKSETHSVVVFSQGSERAKKRHKYVLKQYNTALLRP